MGYKECYAYGILDIKLTSVATELKGRDIEMFEIDKTFALYKTPEQAINAIYEKQQKALEEAPSIHNNKTAITCKEDKQRNVVVYPAPMFIMQPINVQSVGYGKITEMYKNREDGYLGEYNEDKTLENSGPYGEMEGLPTIIIGKDEVADVQIIEPDTKSAKKFTKTIYEAAAERIEHLQAYVNSKYFDSLEQQGITNQSNNVPKEDIFDNRKDNPGLQLMQSFIAQLNQMPGCEKFVSQLKVSYQNNISRFNEYESKDTSKSAYAAAHNIFSKAQVATFKNGDMESATKAKMIADMAGNALDSINQEERNAACNSGAHSDSWKDLGIYIPEEECMGL